MFKLNWTTKHRLGELYSPKKEGDVGYDIPIVIKQSDMSFFEYWLSLLLSSKALHIIWPFTSKMLHSDVYIELPNDVWGKIEGRSSASKKQMMVLGGIIDSGYRGEYFTVLYNFSFFPRIVRTKERYAQVIFHNAVRPFATFASEINTTERGQTGFGSTGK